MKTLLIIAQCDPDDVGESQWGYRIASGMAQRTDATLLTMAKPGREGIAAAAIPGARVIEYSEPPLRRISERFTAVAKPTHYAFYYFARRAITRLFREESFDLVHCCTPAAPRYPAPIAQVPASAAVIAGPYSGGLRTPPGYESEARTMSLVTRLRGMDSFRYRHDPMIRAALRRADLTLAAAPYVLDEMRDAPLRHTALFMPIGVAKLPDIAPKAPAANGAIRLLFIGRLIRTKGAVFAIRALEHLSDLGRVEFDIVGDGEDRQACERAAQSLGPHATVRFHGKLPNARAMEFFRTADMFVFPSFREPAGNVALESMSHATPMIIMDYGGPSAIMPREAGIALPLGQPSDLAERLAGAIRTLALDPERRARMGIAGRSAIESEFLWSIKLERLEQLYQSALGFARTRVRS